jgi:tRNA-dihydrouridine synthase B
MDSKIYLAPLSSITDLPFRLISREFGVKLCFFGMLDSNALVHGHPGTRRLIKTIKRDKPIAAQLLGSDPFVISDAAQQLTSLADISFLEINSACPARKVIKKKAGAYLLKDPQHLGKILKKLGSDLHVPVTVKLRTGFYKKDPKEIVRISKVCRENGASMVFIHGRTVSQKYSGAVDYESIKAVKDALEIPVFGSGDIFNPILAGKMFDETGCDGILVARGALGNPWIFRDIENYLKHGKIAKKPTLAARKITLKKHLSYIEKYREMSHANKIGFMGKVTMWYLKGLPNAPRIRERINRVRSCEELNKLIDGITFST